MSGDQKTIDPGKTLDCPFCESKRLVVDVDSSMHTSMTYRVKCERCGARGPVAGTNAAAVRCWNWRAKR